MLILLLFKNLFKTTYTIVVGGKQYTNPKEDNKTIEAIWWETKTKKTEAQLLSGAWSLNQMHLTPSDVLGAVLNSGYVAAMTKIVLIHAVPQNF